MVPDTILQRIHHVFSHHRALFSLNATLDPRRLLTSMYHKTTTSYMVNYALIKLGYLGRRLSFLLSSFYTKILHHSPSLHHFQHLIFFRKPYDTYSNPNAEQQYWDSAERGLRQLRLSDARFVGSDRPKNVRVPEMPPLVMYYVPALLPRYRDSDEKTICRKRRIKENSRHLDLEDYYRVAFSDSNFPD